MDFLIERADVSAEKLAAARRNPEPSESYQNPLVELEMLGDQTDNNLSNKSDIPKDLNHQQQPERDMQFVNEADSEAELELLKALRKVR